MRKSSFKFWWALRAPKHIATGLPCQNALDRPKLALRKEHKQILKKKEESLKKNLPDYI